MSVDLIWNGNNMQHVVLNTTASDNNVPKINKRTRVEKSGLPYLYLDTMMPVDLIGIVVQCLIFSQPLQVLSISVNMSPHTVIVDKTLTMINIDIVHLVLMFKRMSIQTTTLTMSRRLTGSV